MTLLRLAGRASAVAVMATVAIAGTALAAAPSALWHMEDPAVMTDSSGHGNNGKTTAITGVPGTTGRGYHFNGTTSNALVPTSASLNPGTARLTLTMKVQFTIVPNTSVGDYDLIRKGLASAQGGEYKMEILPNASHTAAQAFCLFKDGAKVVGRVRDTKNLADGAWHTVSCVKAPGTVQVVVDGVTRSANASLGGISNTAPMSVGNKTGGGDQYAGNMDETSVGVG